MPHIIVTAQSGNDSDGRAVMFTERVTASDFESTHFQSQLVERIGWAVGDAQVVEDRPATSNSNDEELEADEGNVETPRPASPHSPQRRSARVLTTAS